MTVRLTSVVSGDAAALIDFLASNSFPFHVTTRHTRDSASDAVGSGRFFSDESRGYWIDDDAGRHGIVVLEDLQDDTSMIDLRLGEGSRGRGIGTDTLRALADLVFSAFPDPRRLEGQTREDNEAMRNAFVRAGFVQESFYRQGWPVGTDTDGTYIGTVGYALLRDDWRRGTTTPLPEDEPRRWSARRGAGSGAAR